jgi:hypothetical protein
VEVLRHPVADVKEGTRVVLGDGGDRRDAGHAQDEGQGQRALVERREDHGLVDPLGRHPVDEVEHGRR